MKTKLSQLVALAVAATFTFIGMTTSAAQGGTDILHFAVRKTMANEGVETNAIGSVIVSQNQQGHANNQRLAFVAKSLGTNATYQLFALLGDDTNFTYAADFTSDSSGKAVVRYMKVGSSKGKAKGSGKGKGKAVLPAVLDPISDIRELAIANANTQAVLTADLTVPDKLAYLVKRTLTEGSVNASLRIFATTNVLQFRLLTRGLVPSTGYFLAANSDVVDTGTSSTNGFLQFTNLPIVPTDILNLHTLAIWDSTSNSVISTQLP